MDVSHCTLWRPIFTTRSQQLDTIRVRLWAAALTWRLEHEGEGVGLVLGLECDDVLVAGALEDLAQVAQVQAQRDVAVAAEVVKALRSQLQRAQGHVRRVHRLWI